MIKTNLKQIRSVIETSFQEFFKRSTSGGIVILVSTAIALIWSNSPFQESYHQLLHQPISVTLSWFQLYFPFERFVNDGLMVLFFLVVGLEIKREILVGELSTTKRAILPLIAAVFGMIGPGTIYAAFNAGTPAIRGWGIPVATDIAFALGVLALLGPRVPIGLKVFLAALAIADDLLAVLVIALFYSSELNLSVLLAAGIVTCILYGGNRIGIKSVMYYAIFGVALWVLILFSGIHPTIAGVVLALTIPADAKIDSVGFSERAADIIRKIRHKVVNDEEEGIQMDNVHALEEMCEAVQSPLHRIEHALQGWVSFAIIPVFALVNAGVVIDTSSLSKLYTPVGLGIVFGLFIGKQVGITAAVWGLVRLKLAVLPKNVSLLQIYGVSIICGIGFTMALFVANLAFVAPADLNISKLGIITGSLLSSIFGLLFLRRVLPKQATA
ncbi:MAG: Na+/H+ antiporter NhaA [Ignavibacteria bacterium]|nr:Na+/H+ antiporter NhaA [Ignavibacteria bacterium]